jgi:hypothetical protein
MEIKKQIEDGHFEIILIITGVKMSSSTDENKTIKNKYMSVSTNTLCDGTHTLFVYSPNRSYIVDLSSSVSKKSNTFTSSSFDSIVVFTGERPKRGRPMIA